MGAADKRADELLATLEESDRLSEGHDPEFTNAECWRESVVRDALFEAVRMVTHASMAYDEEHGEMNDEPHPMDVVAPENVKRVYATSRPWAAPVIAIDLEETPAYFDNGTLTETREVYGRRKPGLSQESTWVRIQLRSSP